MRQLRARVTYASLTTRDFLEIADIKRFFEGTDDDSGRNVRYWLPELTHLAHDEHTRSSKVAMLSLASEQRNVLGTISNHHAIQDEQKALRAGGRLQGELDANLQRVGALDDDAFGAAQHARHQAPKRWIRLTENDHLNRHAGAPCTCRAE